MIDDLRKQAMRAAQFKAKRRALGQSSCAACGGTTTKPEHKLCRGCWHRLPVVMRMQVSAGDDIESVVAYLRWRKSHVFAWVTKGMLLSKSGMQIRKTSRGNVPVWVLEAPGGLELTSGASLPDIFAFFDDMTSHNTYATKTLIR